MRVTVPFIAITTLAFLSSLYNTSIEDKYKEAFALRWTAEISQADKNCVLKNKHKAKLFI